MGEERDMLMGKLKVLQYSFNEEIKKSYKGAESLQVLRKYLKLTYSARKSADSPTCLHSDSFEINKRKLQRVNIDSGDSSLNKFKLIILQHKRKNYIKSR